MTCVVFIKNWNEIVQCILFKLLQAFSVLHLKLIKILNYKFRKKELSSCVLGYSSSLSPIRGLNNVVAKLYQVNKSAGRVRCSLELTYHLVNPLEGSTNQEPRGGQMKILSSLPNIILTQILKCQMFEQDESFIGLYSYIRLLQTRHPKCGKRMRICLLFHK